MAKPDIEVFAELTNERYRVLEAKVNNNSDKIDKLSEHTEDRFTSLLKEVYEMRTEIRTSAATSQQSTKNTIITAAGTIIAGLLTLGVTLLVVLL